MSAQVIRYRVLAGEYIDECRMTAHERNTIREFARWLDERELPPNLPIAKGEEL